MKRLRLLLVAALVLALGGGRGFGGGRGGAAADNPIARIGQAKTGLMAGMPATEQTTRAYASAKSEVPKAIADAQALLVKARDLSASLAKHDVTLTVPPPPTAGTAITTPSTRQ